jgi:hypothetical protein
VIGAVVTSSVHGSFKSGFPVASHSGWWITFGCAVVILALGILTTGAWARASAARTAARFTSEAREGADSFPSEVRA